MFIYSMSSFYKISMRRHRNLRRTNSMIPIGPFPQRCQRTQGSITSQGDMQELLICCNDVCNQASSHLQQFLYISDAFKSEHTKIVSLMHEFQNSGRASPGQDTLKFYSKNPSQQKNAERW